MDSKTKLGLLVIKGMISQVNTINECAELLDSVRKSKKEAIKPIKELEDILVEKIEKLIAKKEG